MVNWVKIKEMLSPLYQSMADKAKQAHQKYLAQESLKLAQEQALRIQQNMACLRKELFEVFSTSNYPKLIPLRTLQNIRPVSYEIQGRIVLYYFTIDKEQCEKIAMTICNSICQDMKNDIITYGQFLIENYFPEELQLMYPNLWYGVQVLNVVNQETNVRLTIVSNRPL